MADKGRSHRPFAVVLAGGGARGYAHAGVLRALEHHGFFPSAIVGVSMGAIVGATYAARDDWFDALLAVDLSGFPHPVLLEAGTGGVGPTVRHAVELVETAWNMVVGWGAPDSVVESARAALRTLLGDTDLEGGRVPVTVCATELRTGARVQLRSGPAREAVYASAALAGLFPPAERDGMLLADGAYTDVAPVDVAHAMGVPVVVAVDPGDNPGLPEIHNGLQALLQAMEILQMRHSDLRIGEADFVLRPVFSHPIDVLDFGERQRCAAAGVRIVRGHLGELRTLLEDHGT